MDIASIVIGILIGLFAGALFVYLIKNKQNAAFKDSISKLQSSLEIEKTQHEEKKEELDETGMKMENLWQENTDLREIQARKEAEKEFLTKKMEEQKAEFGHLQEKMNKDFELLASRIMKQNTEEFSEINKKRVDEILSPFKERIVSFEKKVEDTYQKGLRDQTDLKAELKKLYELNNKISEEASNLTKALKGDSKTQGDWGEVILERILERSGLEKDREYKVQMNVKDETGHNLRPDVVILLPEEKHIVIDSKVSLKAYEKYVNAETDIEKERYIKEHIDSLKRHVKELADKQYHLLSEFNTPEFVLLFVPIESSFSVAIQHEQSLFSVAWESKIVIVSPSTLFATLKTIESIWKQEKQTRNAQEIAKEAGGLHDKFYGFVSDLESVGKGILQTQERYDEAMKKLTSGKGNLMTRVEKLKILGAKADKSLSDKRK
jgi:DNA recombination protein RmuC